jgi:deoxycytidylate deaminase
MSICRKQVVTCSILAPSGEMVSATNSCTINEGVHECPRVTAGCKTGEGYDLCGPPKHAEEEAILKAQERGIDIEGGTAFLEGHDYFCPDCQKALIAAGVRCFNVCAP